jgi:hypothetical protein
VCNTRRVKRPAGLVLLLAAVAVAVAVTWAVRERRSWAERWVLSVAEEWGVGPVHLEVAELDHAGARVLHLEVGDPVALRVEQLDLTWAPTEIARLQVDQLVLRGVTLRAALDDEGAISFGALDPLFEDDGEGAFALPHEVTIADASLELATPLGAVPVRFEVRAEREGDAGVAFAFEAETEGGGVRTSGTGSLVPEAGTGRIEVVLAPVALGPDAVSPATLAPAFAAQLPAIRGGLSGRMSLGVGAEPTAAYSVSGELKLEALSLEHEGTRLEGLDGRIRFAGPDPWRTSGPQELRFARLDLVGPLRDGTVRFEARGTEVDLTSFEGRWAGGRVTTRGRFDAVNREGGFTVEVTGLALEALLKELDIADLAGTGHLSGTVPVVITKDALRVAAALAADPEGGVIRWQPAAGAAKRLGLTGDLALVADALENYHYEELRVGLTGDLAGDVQMRLGLKGSNPAYEGGRPVHLDLQVETNVPATLLASRAATRMPEALERRLRERALAR